MFVFQKNEHIEESHLNSGQLTAITSFKASAVSKVNCNLKIEKYCLVL